MQFIPDALRQLVRFPLLDDRGLADDLAARMRADVARLGVEVTGIIQFRRGDSKIVAHATHPIWGACIAKWISPELALGSALTHVETTRRLTAHEGSLLPRVLHYGPHFTVEERVVGRSLDVLTEAEWATVDLPAFHRALRRFSESSASDERLTTVDTRLILNFYLKKLYLRTRHLNVGERIALRLRLIGQGRELRQRIHAARRALAAISLPRLTAHNDLGAQNVILEEGTGALRVIDVEHTRPGHYLFDCLWMLVSATRVRSSMAVLEATYGQLGSDDFTGVEGAGNVARRMLAFMLELEVMMRPGRHAGPLLALVDRDIRTTSGARSTVPVAPPPPRASPRPTAEV